MIVVDLETSGLDPLKNGILEIGAMKFENPEIYFYEKSRLDNDDKIDPKALEVNGYSEQQARDVKKLSQKQLLNVFFEWVNEQQDFYFAGQNIGGFDNLFLKKRAEKYGLKIPIQYRSLDIQSIAQLKYYQVFGNLLLGSGKSLFGLSNVLKFCGMEDFRKKHNALEDCKLETECIFRILNGKGLLKEYAKYKLPRYLKK